jgi:hypothetical protein
LCVATKAIMPSSGPTPCTASTYYPVILDRGTAVGK